MKKYLILVLAALTVIAAVSCTGKAGPTGPAGKDANDLFTPPALSTILVNENFESYAVGVTPTGWTRANIWNADSSVYHPVTNTTFLSYSKCLMVQGISTLDRQIVKCPNIQDAIPNTLSGKVYLQFYVNKSASNKAKGFVFYIHQLEKLRIDFAADSTIQAYTNINSSVPIGAYQAGEWTKVNVILNLTAQKYDVYTDGILRVQNIPCYNTIEQLNSTTQVGPPDRIYTDFFGVLTNQTVNFIGDAVYLDDVLIYYVP